METCKSPRKVLNAAYALATACLDERRSKFSRKDFTAPQLFACLVLREHQKKSYRGLVALLRDCPEWCADIGLKKVPDRNTLCRAFHRLVKPGAVEAMLDKSVQTARQLERRRKKKRRSGRRRKDRRKRRVAALDSTMFESRHVSRHFEKRCKQSACQARKKQRRHEEAKQRQAQKKAAKVEANRRRAMVVKRLPKLSLAVHAASHLILAAQATTGAGADCLHFVPLLSQAKARMSLKVALADAGYDSETNHYTARAVMGIRSLIPATAGRPGAKGPTGHYRRMMRRRLKAGPDKKCYGQRWQVETVNSMIKRNMGSACRARTVWGRKKDILLRSITHNIMLIANLEE